MGSSSLLRGGAADARVRGGAELGGGEVAAVAVGAGRDGVRGGARLAGAGDGQGQRGFQPAHHHGHRAAQQRRRHQRLSSPLAPATADVA
ncbi:hypothetical protein OsI_38992 [Oryza sativa Indica Group]|nr:hypothetical protein OsI_38992 [Oryza sativa Indica Group]